MSQALVTVTDKNYYKGTLVLLYSFLKHHPNFTGDILVIHRRLPKKMQQKIIDGFPVTFIQVSQELHTKLEQLGAQCPQLSNKMSRFYSLELFRLTSYEKLLFLDSDILCKGNLDELWRSEEAFLAAPDLSFYKSEFRHRKSFTTADSGPGGVDVYERTFNAGVMFLNNARMAKNVYSELLNLLRASNYKMVSSGHTDQFLLNQYFEHKVSWLDSRYNYLLRAEELITAKTGLWAKEAILWHYIRNPKPWNFKRLLKNKLKGIQSLPYLGEWLDEYVEMFRETQKPNLSNKLKVLFLRLLRQVC
jgi:lipopolysaccharide biosynthesis glycosyltransferase